MRLVFALGMPARHPAAERNGAAAWKFASGALKRSALCWIQRASRVTAPGGRGRGAVLGSRRWALAVRAQVREVSWGDRRFQQALRWRRLGAVDGAPRPRTGCQARRGSTFSRTACGGALRGGERNTPEEAGRRREAAMDGGAGRVQIPRGSRVLLLSSARSEGAFHAAAPRRPPARAPALQAAGFPPRAPARP